MVTGSSTGTLVFIRTRRAYGTRTTGIFLPTGPRIMKPSRSGQAAQASPTATRTMVLWCPDWPVTAALREHLLPAEHPVALIEKGEVFACSPAAREQGVKRGLRVREAQARCTALTVLPYDPALDARSFEPVIAAVEEIMPGVQLVRPGLCALHAKGPASTENQSARIPAAR